MLSSVSIFRVVAAAYLSASPAPAQMDPSVAHGDTFLTTFAGRGNGLDRPEVCAFLAGFSHLRLRISKFADCTRSSRTSPAKGVPMRYQTAHEDLTYPMHLRSRLFILAIFLAAPTKADPAPFDLAGPALDVKITRGTSTLPASEVPNLIAGDRIWIKADLPATQSAHYLMVAAFLSGSTNPPPESWFFPCKTWTGKCGHDGLTVTVPAGAQQVLVFLAPETGGDFRTLVNAVRGRPGAFVRTSQDLNQAALDRSRLQTYLSAVGVLSDADPAKLAEAAPLLARSLAIKVDSKCLDRIPELQAPCLTEGQESLILNDGHSTSIVEAR